MVNIILPKKFDKILEKDQKYQAIVKATPSIKFKRIDSNLNNNTFTLK